MGVFHGWQRLFSWFAASLILLFAAVNRKQRDKGSPYTPSGIFAFGYLSVWGFFSLLAAAGRGSGSPEARQSAAAGGGRLGLADRQRDRAEVAFELLELAPVLFGVRHQRPQERPRRGVRGFHKELG